MENQDLKQLSTKELTIKMGDLIREFSTRKNAVGFIVLEADEEKGPKSAVLNALIGDTGSNMVALATCLTRDQGFKTLMDLFCPMWAQGSSIITEIVKKHQQS